MLDGDDQRGQIAVGCLGFSCSEELALQTSDYYAKLKIALEEIENLTELEFTNIGSSYGDLRAIGPVSAPKFFPHPYNATIYFKLYIPYRTQEALGFPCATETFEVFIIHHYHFPVAYLPVAGSDLEHSYDLSGRVALIREYFSAKFSSDELDFFCIGPSPFHAIFEAVSGQDPIRLEDIEDSPGYRHYRYCYDPAKGNHLVPFAEKYGDALSLFYGLQVVRTRLLYKEIEVSNSISSLLDPEKNRFSRFLDVFSHRKNVDTIQRAIIECDGHREGIRSELQTAEECKSNSDFTDLRYHFSNLQRMATERHFESERQVLATYEKRGLSVIQNSAVVISGLLGGIVGALGTLLLAN